MTEKVIKKRGRPKVDSAGEKELKRLEKESENYEAKIKSLTLDRMNEAPKLETEEQTKLSQKEINKIPDNYIKPARSISTRMKFNEKYRDKLNFIKEYVHFTAENKEIIGDSLQFWTHPIGGMAAEYWEIPVNKPVWAPRYVAEQIKGCKYHRLTMDEKQEESVDGMGQYFGRIVVDNVVQRLDAHPVSNSKSIFMGA